MLRSSVLAFAVAIAASASAQDNQCELARQAVAADHEEYKRVFEIGQAYVAAHEELKEHICDAYLIKNLTDNVAVLRKEIHDAEQMKIVCTGNERALHGIAKLLDSLKPKLDSATAAVDSIEKACPAK